jgi:hypothetical protein
MHNVNVRFDHQEFVKRNMGEIIAKMQGVKFSDKDKLSDNGDIDGEFGRLNSDGRTLARLKISTHWHHRTDNADDADADVAPDPGIYGPAHPKCTSEFQVDCGAEGWTSLSRFTAALGFQLTFYLPFLYSTTPHLCQVSICWLKILPSFFFFF